MLSQTHRIRIAMAGPFSRKWAMMASTLSAVVIAAGIGGAQAADLDEIKSRGYMLVATEDVYPPWNFITDGAPDGFHKDLLADLKEFVGFEVRQEILPWTGFLASISAGKYDMGWTAAGVTEDRLRVFNFSPPVAGAKNYFVKRKGDTSITDLASLSGKTIGVQLGSAPLARLPELGEMLEATGGELGEVIEHPGPPESIADLMAGRVDYVVFGLETATDAVSARPNDIELSDFPVSGTTFIAWPVPKSSPELLGLLTEFMKKITESGRLAELQEKWIGGAMTLPLEPITSVEVMKVLEKQ